MNPSLVLGGWAVGQMLSVLVSHSTLKMNLQRLIPINILVWKQFGMTDLSRNERGKKEREEKTQLISVH